MVCAVVLCSMMVKDGSSAMSMVDKKIDKVVEGC